MNHQDRTLRPEFVEVHGCKLFLQPGKDVISDCLAQDKVWEPFETHIASTELNQGDVILDLAANIGYFTSLFSKLVGEQGKVFAFEPNPDNFALLQRNVEVNNCTNVTLIISADSFGVVE
jgi:tRNA/tmRNA/rRNA uracil-C5-methylase (TrmA/RlmC/RlmD family)